ncbi:partner and localizer of BRCA2 [Xiphophorus couchianus]|uniref:partner and localizer of BRCA2 n=1 Tax=Xiphophorus couchianus TaxID=32473 RepID=UPI00101630C0|nr:partner and localizer of BRCA2 [Xiphophorus couchianus]XP_027872090.1 partner and localizer of BRCA2 [Xiphophorus couchianus]
MDGNIGNILHSEEQLRNTLQCDDKEKLRRKLAHLQREYLKTAQRLKRAECVDALKRHVKNRISLQKDQDKNDPEITSTACVTPSSFTFNTNDATPGSLQCQGAVESSTIRSQQVIRFLLSGDLTSSKTPDLSSDIAGSHRPSTALRLRSRRSRLRWEKRSANAPEGSHNSQRQQALTGNTRPGDEEQTIRDEDVFIESQELFSDPESESPSLLLTHWSTQEHTKAGDKTGNGNQRSQEEIGKKIGPEVDGKCGRPALTTESKGQNAGENSLINNTMGEDGVSHSQARKPVVCEKGNPDGAQMTAIEKHEDSVEIKEKNNRITADENTVSLLDSCTLVEGLPFPVEYYIRTTRHMTLSQTQPDMQAVIMSQLRAGRQRRSRGRSRRSNQGLQRSDRHTQTDSASSTTPSTSVDSLKLSNVNASKDYSQSSSDFSTSAISEAPVSLRGPSVRPPKGTRTGRGRGRPPRQQLLKQGCSLTSGGLQPSLSFAPSTQLLHQAEETNTESMLFQQTPTHSCPAQPSSPVSETPSGFTAEHQEKISPIFLKSSTSRPQQMNTGSSDCQALLLPSSSSSSSSSSQTAQLSLPSLISRLKSLEIQQDFHLPDDQFASLKLHKLRQVAVESAPSHNTRRRSSCRHSAVDLLMPCSFPLSSTSTIRNSLRPNKSERTSPQQTQCTVTNNLTGTRLNEELCNSSIPETNAELSADALNTSTEAVSLVQEFTEGLEAGTENGAALSSTCTSINTDEPQALVDRTPRKENDVQLSDEPEVEQSENEKQPSLEELGLTDGRITQLLSFDFSESKAAEDAPTSCTNDAAANPPVNNPNPQYPAEDFAEPTKADSSDDGAIKSNASQFLFKSPLDAVGCPCTGLPSIYHPSPTPASSPVLPSLGITPNAARLPSDSSPSAPPLCLPPSPSPSTQDLSPLDLCAGASITSLPSNLPPPSLCSQLQDLSEPVGPRDQGDREEPDDCPTPSRIQLQGSAVEVGITTHGPAQKFLLRCTHTLEAPAGGSLVDVCCVSDPSAGVCVAAAGKWAVCLWSQTSECNWSLKHTWTFSEPVINVFPVPDSTGLMFVSLGQLEIRQLRLLSCCSLRQTLILEDIIQAVAGLFNSRVVTSSDSAAGSTLQVFTLSDSTSLLTPQPLVSPGVCVSALAPVEGLPDALIGTDEVGHLFIWNLKSGQLLSRVLLEDSLSNTACLKGYSYCGVLLVLLQHQFLSSLDQEEKKAREKCLLSEARSKPALFSLVGINPLSGRSVLSTWLYPPDGWTGRLCEVDVNRCSVVGLSQSGCVCVWELGEGGTSQMMEAQEDGYWQLARWGHEDTLVIGHQNGDVSLHPYDVRPTKKGAKADAETPPL